MAIELRHLRYFVAVADHGSVAEASRQLHIVQPALSRQIREMEEMLGAEVFRRNARGVELTPPGTQFLRDARRILRDMDDARERALRVAKGQAGTIRLGIAPNYSWHPDILQWLRDFQARYPDINVRLEPLLAARQLQAIDEGKLDGGFLAWRDRSMPQFRARELFECRLKLAVSRTGHLAQAVPARLADLKDEPFISFSREVAPAYYDFLIHQCQLAGLSPRMVQSGADIGTTLGLVAAGLGYAIVPDTSVHSCPLDTLLLDHPDLTMTYPVEFVWRAGDDDPALHQFIDMLPTLAPTQHGHGTPSRQGMERHTGRDGMVATDHA